MPTYTYTGPTSLAVTRWVFFDPTDASSDVFELNPQDGGAVARERTVSQKSRRAPGAKTVIVTNSQGARQFTFSGTILTETMYNLFVLWFNKGYPVEITDDLGQTFSVYITKFEAQRVHKPYNPWFHTYNVTGIII